MSAEILKALDKPSRNALTRYAEERIEQIHRSLETAINDDIYKYQGAAMELRKILTAINRINEGQL